MPAQGDDTTPLVVVDHLLGDTGERYAVQTLGVGHLDTAQFEAHHGGVVAAHVLHITTILVVFPGQTIHRVILMTEHIAFLTERIQSLE